MEITHIVETDSLSKLKSCQLRETYVIICLSTHDAKATFETFKDSNSLNTSLCIEYIGNLKSKRSCDF